MNAATYAPYRPSDPPRERIRWCSKQIAILSRRISACQQRRANLIARREHIRAEMRPLSPNEETEEYEYENE